MSTAKHTEHHEQPQRPSAPPVVLLHGSGDDAHVWDDLRAHLPEYETLALDLPGHGAFIDSPGPEEMSVAEYAAAVRSELERRSLGPVCLAGHSLGSAIALRLGVDSPALVSHLVLVGAGARLRVLPALLEQARTDPPAAARELKTLAFQPEHGALRDSWLARYTPLAPGMLHRDLAACNAFDMMGQLGSLTQPTLILTGEGDRLTPPKYASYLRDAIAHSELVIVPGAGHYLPLEQPEAAAQAIRSWLQRV